MFKEQSWLKSVSIEDNKEYIENLLKKFKINTYNFIYNGYREDLKITYNLNEYQLSIDEYDKCLKIRKKNQCYNKKKKEYYHLWKVIDGPDVWCDGLKNIIKRG